MLLLGGECMCSENVVLIKFPSYSFNELKLTYTTEDYFLIGTDCIPCTSILLTNNGCCGISTGLVSDSKTSSKYNGERRAVQIWSETAEGMKIKYSWNTGYCDKLRHPAGVSENLICWHSIRRFVYLLIGGYFQSRFSLKNIHKYHNHKDYSEYQYNWEKIASLNI